MSISRRTFLAGTTAAAVAPFLSVPTMAAPAAASQPLLAFAVGTPGEFDWQAVLAKSPEEAFRTLMKERGWVDDLTAETTPFDPEYVRRTPAWDGLEEVTPADWLEAGLGHCCERCGSETDRASGGRVVDIEVVCEECLTLSDRIEVDPESAIDELADLIASDGEAAAREQLEISGAWDAVTPDIWARAIAEAA